MENLNTDSRQRVQTFGEALAQGHQPQPAKDCTVVVALYHAIVRLRSVSDPYQRSKLAISCNETDN